MKKFTLTELLIVIAIIGILISILLPSLQNARYKAKLAVCKSNLYQVYVANVNYATFNDRYFVKRYAADSHIYGAPYQVQTNKSKKEDDRQVFKDLNLWGFGCPFNRLPTELNKIKPTYSLRFSYSMFFGWRGKNVELTHMLKPMVFKGTEFNIVASDILHPRPRRGLSYSSHSGEDYIRVGSTEYVGNKVNWTWTEMKQDTNFARNDGSIYMENNVTAEDSRMTKLPYENQGFSTSDYLYLPKEMK